MPVDENFWPGPTWDFTVHTGGFPAVMSAGDLYVNFSGLRYLCTGKEYKAITADEWDKLLDEDTSDEDYLAGYNDGGTLQLLRVGDLIKSMSGNYIVHRRVNKKTNEWDFWAMPYAVHGGAVQGQGFKLMKVKINGS